MILLLLLLLLLLSLLRLARPFRGRYMLVAEVNVVADTSLYLVWGQHIVH